MQNNPTTPASAGASPFQHSTHVVRLTLPLPEDELKRMLPRLFRRGVLPRMGEIDVLELHINVTRRQREGGGAR